MKCRADVALGVAGGYLLGRRKKIKFALALGSVAAGLRWRKPAPRLVAGSATPGSDDTSRTETLTERRPTNTFDGQATDAAPQLRMGGAEDVDGAGVSETEDVIFSLDGRQYRLDLSVEDAAKLRDSLAPFVAVARPRGRNGRGRHGRTGGRGSPRRR